MEFLLGIWLVRKGEEIDNKHGKGTTVNLLKNILIGLTLALIAEIATVYILNTVQPHISNHLNKTHQTTVYEINKNGHVKEIKLPNK